MFNTASKLQYGFAAVALVLAVVYGAAIDDPAGFVLMLGVFVAFTLGAMAVSAAGVSDRAPRYSSLKTRLRCRPSSLIVPALLPPNPWPLIGAVAAGTLAVGAAVSDTVVIVGVIACLIAASGWFAQAWREDPSYTAREGERISERLIGPFGLPVLALTVIGIIVISLSRVLLAVPKKGSVVFAIVVAVVIMATFFAISARPGMRRTTVGFLAGFSSWPSSQPAA